MSARIGVRLGLDCRRGLSKTLPSITASPIRRPSIHHGLTLSPFQIPTLPSRSLYFSSVICAAQHQTQVQSEHKADRTEAGTLAPKGITEEYQPEKLSEDILTVPNVLTMLRLASTPVLGYLVLIDEMPYALGLLAVSGFTDVLDGWLARRYKSSTVFGSIADPAADKALMTVMVGALAWRGLIPLPLVILIVGRDIALVVSAFLIRYRSLPEPKTFARYWDPRLPSAQVKPTQISKYNTFLQIVLVAGCTLIASLNDNWTNWWNSRQGLWNDSNTSIVAMTEQRDWGDAVKKGWHSFMVVVSATTIWSGASYLFGGGSIYLSQKANLAKERMSKLRK